MPRSSRQRQRYLSYLVGLGATLLVAAAYLAGAFQVLEMRAYDLRFRWFGRVPDSERILHVDIDDEKLEEPFVIGFVKIDGTKGGLVHYIKAPEVKNGMKVRAVLKKERVGSILDIEHFAP